jgi:hypothetical protein
MSCHFCSLGWPFSDGTRHVPPGGGKPIRCGDAPRDRLDDLLDRLAVAFEEECSSFARRDAREILEEFLG